jgi:hypothetical protein
MDANGSALQPADTNGSVHPPTKKRHIKKREKSNFGLSLLSTSLRQVPI